MSTDQWTGSSAGCPVCGAPETGSTCAACGVDLGREEVWALRTLALEMTRIEQRRTALLRILDPSAAAETAPAADAVALETTVPSEAIGIPDGRRVTVMAPDGPTVAAGASVGHEIAVTDEIPVAAGASVAHEIGVAGAEVAADVVADVNAAVDGSPADEADAVSDIVSDGVAARAETPAEAPLDAPAFLPPAPLVDPTPTAPPSWMTPWLPSGVPAPSGRALRGWEPPASDPRPTPRPVAPQTSSPAGAGAPHHPWTPGAPLASPAPAARQGGVGGPSGPGSGPYPPMPPLPTRAARPSPQVSTVLLGLGTALLVVAAIVFATVSWSRMSALGQGVLLIGLTASVALATRAAARRGLQGTAEALGVLTVVLAPLVAQAVRITTNLTAVEDRTWANWAHWTWWPIAMVVLGVGAIAFARRVGVRGAEYLGIVVAQLGLPIWAAMAPVSPAVVALVLLVQGAVVASIPQLRAGDRVGAVIYEVAAGTAWLVGTGLTVIHAFADQDVTGTLRLTSVLELSLGVGASAALISWRRSDQEEVAAVGAAVAAAAAFSAVLRATLGAFVPTAWWPVMGAAAVLGLAVAQLLDPRRRQAVRLVSWAVATVAALPLVLCVGVVLRSIERSLAHVWTQDWSRRVVATDIPVWGAAIPSLGAIAAALIVDRRSIGTRAVRVGLLIMGVTGAVVVPILLGSPLAVVVALAIAAAVALGLAARRATAPQDLLFGAVVAWAWGGGWALAGPGLTLVATASALVLAVGVAIEATRRSEPTVAAGAAFVGALATVGSAGVGAHLAGASPPWVWVVVAVLALAGAHVAVGLPGRSAVNDAIVGTSGAVSAVALIVVASIQGPQATAPLTVALVAWIAASVGLAVALAIRDEDLRWVPLVLASVGEGIFVALRLGQEIDPGAVAIVLGLAAIAGPLVAMATTGERRSRLLAIGASSVPVGLHLVGLGATDARLALALGALAAVWVSAGLGLLDARRTGSGESAALSSAALVVAGSAALGLSVHATASDVRWSWAVVSITAAVSAALTGSRVRRSVATGPAGVAAQVAWRTASTVSSAVHLVALIVAWSLSGEGPGHGPGVASLLAGIGAASVLALWVDGRNPARPALLVAAATELVAYVIGLSLVSDLAAGDARFLATAGIAALIVAACSTRPPEGASNADERWARLPIVVALVPVGLTLAGFGRPSVMGTAAVGALAGVVATGAAVVVVAQRWGSRPAGFVGSFGASIALLALADVLAVAADVPDAWAAAVVAMTGTVLVAGGYARADRVRGSRDPGGVAAVVAAAIGASAHVIALVAIPLIDGGTPSAWSAMATVGISGIAVLVGIGLWVERRSGAWVIPVLAAAAEQACLVANRWSALDEVRVPPVVLGIAGIAGFVTAAVATLRTPGGPAEEPTPARRPIIAATAVAALATVGLSSAAPASWTVLGAVATVIVTASLVVVGARGAGSEPAATVGASIGVVALVALAATTAIEAGASTPWVWAVVAITGAVVAAVAAPSRIGPFGELVAGFGVGMGMLGHGVGVVGLLGVLPAEARLAPLSLALAAGSAGCAAVGVTRLMRRGAWQWWCFVAAGEAAALIWFRLAEAHVGVVELYLLPGAALVALACWTWSPREQGPRATPSWLLEGPALVVALAPTTVIALGDPGITRLVIGLTAGSVLLGVGAGLRRRAPIDIGGVVVATLGIQALFPYAAAIPRWVMLGAAGTVLVMLGATFEQRRRDVDEVRRRYSSLL